MQNLVKQFLQLNIYFNLIMCSFEEKKFNIEIIKAESFFTFFIFIFTTYLFFIFFPTTAAFWPLHPLQAHLYSLYKMFFDVYL